MMTLLNLLILAVVFGLTVYAHRRVSIERQKVEDELRSASNLTPLGLFDLSRGNTAAARSSHRLVEPERLWTYDADYLTAFARAVGEPTLGSVYVRRILLGWDRSFAVGLGWSSFLVDVLLAELLEDVPVLWHLLIVAAGMSLLYAAADLAEDAKLSAIFLNEKGVDRGEAAAANALTRVKIAAICLSMAGVAIFQILSHLPTFPTSAGTSAEPGGRMATDPA